MGALADAMPDGAATAEAAIGAAKAHADEIVGDAEERNAGYTKAAASGSMNTPPPCALTLA